MKQDSVSLPPLPGRRKNYSRYTRLAVCSMLALFIGLASILHTGMGALPVAHAVSGGVSSRCSISDPTGGGSCVSGPVVLTAQQQMILAKKTAIAKEYAQARAGTLSPAVYARDAAAFARQYGGPTAMTNAQALSNQAQPNICSPDPCPPSQVVLNVPQYAQINTYYCGPATASEILAGKGNYQSQSTMASSLGTTTSGTPWGNNMPHTLNTYTNSSWYVPVSGSNVGGGFSTTTYENDLVGDISQGWPIAGNIVEYANTDPHLTGHPRSATIYHWIAIMGYSYSGGDTDYVDSIHGDTQFWSWAVNVPAQSSYSSSSMTTLLNQRGYVW